MTSSDGLAEPGVGSSSFLVVRTSSHLDEYSCLRLEHGTIQLTPFTQESLERLYAFDLALQEPCEEWLELVPIPGIENLSRPASHDLLLGVIAERWR
jgi:hypothetical protein